MISHLPSQRSKRRNLLAKNRLPTRDLKVDASSSTTPDHDVDIERISQTTVREPLFQNPLTVQTRIPIFNDAEIQNLLEILDSISKERSKK